MKPPIILIPGIQGTKLANINKKNFDTIWSGICKFFDNLYDILLDLDGKTDKQKEVIIERQDVEDLAYSEIINFLKNLGYPVYIFGYDWRKSNLESGKDLLKFARVVRKKHPGNAKINFITHSMGCLVFSGFLRQLTAYQQKTFINKVIFTVPPFMGSVEAIFNLIIGKSKLFNSSDDFREIARTFPAIFELCPVYPGAVRFKNGQKFNIYNYDHWQQDTSKPDASAIRLQYETRLKDLEMTRSMNDLIFDLSALPANMRERMLVVAGSNEDTQREIKVNNDNSPVLNQFDFDPQFEDKEGDGTVHIKSAGVFKDSITTLEVESRWLEKRLDGRVIMADWHSFFLNNGRVQNILKRFFAYEHSALNANWYQSVGGGVKKM